MLGAQDTLCGQAYGAENYKMLGTGPVSTCARREQLVLCSQPLQQSTECAGVVTQRALVISLLLCAPVILAWTRVDGLMLLMGQAPDVVKKAKAYLLMTSPCLPLGLVNESLSRFQAAQV